MARQSFDYTHGDTGTKPGNPLDFAKGERPQAQQFDWYWYKVTEAISGHADEFTRLDKDDDGVVDESDTVAAGGNLKGNLNDAAGNQIYNNSGNYVVQNRLENDSVTVTAGTGIDSAGTVALGESVTVDVDTTTIATRTWATGNNISHSDLSDAPSDAHHTRYSDSEARTAVNGANVDIAGDADTVDGKHYSDIQDWVNSSSYVPNANYADDAGTVGGNNIYVQSTEPSNPTSGDVWVDTS